MRHLINQTVCLRVIAGHEIVPVGVTRDALDWLPRVVREQMIQPFLQVQDLSRAWISISDACPRAPPSGW